MKKKKSDLGWYIYWIILIALPMGSAIFCAIMRSWLWFAVALVIALFLLGDFLRRLIKIRKINKKYKDEIRKLEEESGIIHLTNNENGKDERFIYDGHFTYQGIYYEVYINYNELVDKKEHEFVIFKIPEPGVTPGHS